MSGTIFLTVIFIVVFWEMVWKGIALWKSAKHSQLGWFIAILILNTAGILPIIYIYHKQIIKFFQKKKK